MPGVKKKDLHLAKSMAELNKLAGDIPAVKNLRICVTSAQKLIKKADETDLMGDEEAAYVLYMRYFNLISAIKKTVDYKKNENYYNDLLGKKNIVKALEEAERLSSNIKTRYEEREAKMVSDKLAALNNRRVDAEVKRQEEKNEEVAEEKAAETQPGGAEGTSSPEQRTGFLSMSQFYSLLHDKDTSLLIVDIRSPEDYHASQVCHTNCINVPKTIITPGITVNKLEPGLPQETMDLWKRRHLVDYIILIDWTGGADDLQLKAPLQSLKDALYKWDMTTVVKSEPLVLEGGYCDLLVFYPMLTTNSKVPRPVITKPTDNLVPSLDTIDYDLELNFLKSPEELAKEEAKKKNLTIENLSEKFQDNKPGLPNIDRTLKPKPVATNSNRQEIPLNTYVEKIPKTTNQFRKPELGNFRLNNLRQELQVDSVKDTNIKKQGTVEIPKPSINRNPEPATRASPDLSSNEPSGSEPSSSSSSHNGSTISLDVMSTSPQKRLDSELSRDNRRLILESQARLAKLQKEQEELGRLQAVKQREASETASLMRTKRQVQEEIQQLEQLLQEKERRMVVEDERWVDEQVKRRLAEEDEDSRRSTSRVEEENKKQQKEESRKQPTKQKNQEARNTNTEAPSKRKEAELRAQRDMEEKLQKERDAAAKVKQEQEENEKQEATLKLQKEKEEREKREAAHKDRGQQEHREAVVRAQIEKEEREKREAAAHTHKEKEDREKREAAARAQIEKEQKEKREVAARAQIEKEQKEKREAVIRAELEKEQKEKREAVIRAQIEKEQKEKREAAMRKEVEDKARKEAEERAKQESKAPQPKLVTPGLKVGWEKRLDRSTGRYYYIDHKTQKTHWEPPQNTAIQAAPGSTHKVRLKEEPDTPSSGGGMKRSHSSPNIAKMMADEDDERRAFIRQPQIDRGNKPKNRPQLTLQTEVSAAKVRNLQPVWGSMGRGLTGLKNLGNTCYMNSIIQCLSNTAPLTTYILTDNYRHDINRENIFGKGGDVAEEFAVLIKALWSGQYKSVSPRDFKLTVAKYHEMFAGCTQQDSQELLLFLMDGLHEDLNKVVRRKALPEQDNDGIPDEQAAETAWRLHKTVNESVIVELFQGQFKSIVRCLTCGKKSVTFDAFMYLTLPIPSSTRCSLKDCLLTFSKEEKMTGESRWHCPDCRCPRDAVKQIVIWKLPPILLIHLKRFYYQGMWRQKITTYVDFPLDDLDMNKYIANNKSRRPYSLYGVSNHYGSLDGGHYTAYCKNPTAQRWYKYDDQDVFDINSRDIQSSAAYTLFYTSIDMAPLFR